MQVTIKLFATLRTGRFSSKLYECQTEETVAQLLENLGLQNAGVLMVIINNRTALSPQKLTDGDIVSIFPLLDGG